MTPLLNRHRALVSWGALGLLLIVLLLLLLTPLLDRRDSYRLELVKDGRILQRYQAVAGSRRELEGAMHQFQARHLGEWVFPAEQSPDTVVLNIQKRVSEILTASHARVRSIAPLRAPANEGYIQAGIRVQFTASLAELLEVLQALEANRPLLIIDDMRLIPAVSRILGPHAPQPQAVEAIVSVVTYLPAASAGEVQP